MVVSIIALLLSILLPSLRHAREQARTAVCGSNIRQLAIANTTYACDHQGRYCPGAAGMKTDNLYRWHGARGHDDEPFNPRRAPLAPYLGVDEAIRACPSFGDFIEEGGVAFEEGNGGYGYNQAYVGRVLRKSVNGSFQVVTDEYGVLSARVRRPSETVMFTDSAFAAGAGGVIEYSFTEPRFHPEWLHLHARADPSIHFRHCGRSSIAWCDSHVGQEARTFTWQSIAYPDGNPERENIGWFGARDDNGYFNLE